MREGGSMPALVEADDGQQYVVKLRGAGQGTLALVAELIVGEMGRALGLHVPELVFVEIDPMFGRAERDPEIRDLLRASSGINIGLKFLTGATTFDPTAGDAVDAIQASLIVWLDAFALNVDRTARNANLLVRNELFWLSKDLRPIDHGAALYFHHNWPSMPAKILSKAEHIKDHILLAGATEIAQAGAHARTQLTPRLLREIVGQIPDDWLESEAEPGTAAQRRKDYLEFLENRLNHASIFEEEIERVRTGAV